MNIPEKLDLNIQIGSDTHELIKWNDFKNTGLFSWIQLLLAVCKWRIEEFYIKDEEDIKEIKSVYLPFRTNESLHVKFFNNMNKTNIRDYINKNSKHLLGDFIEDDKIGIINCKCMSQTSYHIIDNNKQEYNFCKNCLKKLLLNSTNNIFPILIPNKNIEIYRRNNFNEHCINCNIPMGRTVIFNI